MFTNRKPKMTGVRMSQEMRQAAEVAAVRCGYPDMSEFIRDALTAYIDQSNRLYHSKLSKLIDRAKSQGAISERAMLRADLTGLDSKICEIMHAADLEAMPLVVERNAVARRLNAIEAASAEEVASRNELDKELRAFESRPAIAQ